MLLLTTVSLTTNFLLIAILVHSYRQFRKKNRTLLYRLVVSRLVINRQRIWKGNPLISTSTKSPPVSHQQELFIRLRNYLHTNKKFTHPDLKTKKLVTDLFTNRSYLFEAVKRATGMTLQEYLTSLRLEEARRLLEHTDERIETIANICGYNSVRTFYRLFRSHYHMSPATYRNTIR